jgi:hypothetical protein
VRLHVSVRHGREGLQHRRIEPALLAPRARGGRAEALRVVCPSRSRLLLLLPLALHYGGSKQEKEESQEAAIAPEASVRSPSCESGR